MLLGEPSQGETSPCRKRSSAAAALIQIDRPEFKAGRGHRGAHPIYRHPLVAFGGCECDVLA